MTYRITTGLTAERCSRCSNPVEPFDRALTDDEGLIDHADCATRRISSDRSSQRRRSLIGRYNRGKHRRRKRGRSRR